MKFVAGTEPERLVFLDESYCRTGMRRGHAWSPSGQRAVAKRPMGKWTTVSLVGAIRLGERPKLMTHRGSVNGEVFLEFVQRRLTPWLRPGDLVIMDNFRTHWMLSVRDAIYAVGAQAVYLPPYSPELNPIELWWADVKRQMRKLALDTEEEVRRGARALRAAVPLRKIEGWFRHAARELRLSPES